MGIKWHWLNRPSGTLMNNLQTYGLCGPYGWSGSLWPQLPFFTSDLISHLLAKSSGARRCWLRVRQMEPWSLRSAVLSHTSVCFFIWLHFLLIYLTNYLKVYWVPMTYTKMEKKWHCFLGDLSLLGEIRNMNKEQLRCCTFSVNKVS